MSRKTHFYCYFCGRAEHEVSVMVAGPANVAICDYCIEDAAEAVAKKQAEMALEREWKHCAGCCPDPVELKALAA